MRRFQFRLEPFLRLREYKEREWKLKMAEVTGRVVELESQLEDLGQERGRNVGAGKGVGVLNVGDLIAREHYVFRLDRQTEELRSSLQEQEERREEVRRELNDAMKQRKVLDALKERRANEYYAEARRAEGKRLDDLATTKTAHDRRDREDANVQL